jgi:BirA family biotin operon repressor/biotin-[acetyl-CoA-carboxylase] ligase
VIGTRFIDVRRLDEVDSTNRYLLDLARDGASEGVVVVADYQTAGRGRRDRTWEARPGSALLMSVLLRPPPPPAQWWRAGAAMALAAADACGAAGTEAVIKWPNDLLTGDAKLAGVLAEADGGAVVVGIGINVGWAPPAAAALGPGVDRDELLAALLVNLEHWCRHWGEIAPAYRRRCGTVGRRVRVELSDRVVSGWATAVDTDGRLEVAADTGEALRLASAEVVHVTGA